MDLDLMVINFSQLITIIIIKAFLIIKAFKKNLVIIIITIIIIHFIKEFIKARFLINSHLIKINKTILLLPG